MAAWQASAGATLLVPSGPIGQHLFVVLCDPVVLAGYGLNPCVVMANLSTVRAGIPHDPMTPVLLQRIQAGRLTSPRTKQEFRLLQI